MQYTFLICIYDGFSFFTSSSLHQVFYDLCGIRHRKRSVPRPGFTKLCSSPPGTKTTLPGPRGISPRILTTAPVPSRTKTSCSQGWAWNGVRPPGSTSISRMAKVGAPSPLAMSQRMRAPSAPVSVTTSCCTSTLRRTSIGPP